MSRPTVTFIYLTGIKDRLFTNVHLKGSWDGDGRFSDQWSCSPMQSITGPDGCPAFTATVRFADDQIGSRFHWGVFMDGPAGAGQWGINSEVNDHLSLERYREFELTDNGPGREERYYLNESRRLGAQPFSLPDREKNGIRFAVRAPNALEVEVVMGLTWLQGDPDRVPQDGPLPRDRICGGYVSDEGRGIRSDWIDREARTATEPQWGPFVLNKMENGIWVSDIHDPLLADFGKFDHKPYMYRIKRDDGSWRYRTDLYSRCQIGFGADVPDRHQAYLGRTMDLDGTVSCSVVVDPDRTVGQFEEPVFPEENWIEADQFWQDEYNDSKPVPRRVEDLVIYELHLGALGFGKPDNQPGTLKDAMKLLDTLEELGINAIELLPLSEFGGGGGGWGYATSHYFAIEYSGGGRDRYKWFVRECHRRGFAVIMDVVYNHYSHDAERAEWMYDSPDHTRNIYYWYEGRPNDYPAFQAAVEPEKKDTGGYVDNMSTGWAPRYWDEHVRKMFVSSALTLVMEFHIDGFRMDQTTSIHNYNRLHADGREMGVTNLYGQKLLRELTRSLKLVKPEVMLMAEDHSNWDKVTESTDQGGLGFDAAWYSDFYHHLMGDGKRGPEYARLIHTAGLGGDEALAMGLFARALADSGNHKVVYNESHDEAGNGECTHRTIHTAVNGAYLGNQATRWSAEARCRVAAGLTLLSAGTPMFLFGEEVGAEKDFIYNEVLKDRENLIGLKENSGARLFRFYRDLIRLRLDNPGFRSRNIHVVHVHDGNRVIALLRWDDQDQYLVAASLNNKSFNHPHYTFNGVPEGPWREIFNSDAAIYRGADIGNRSGTLTGHGGRFSCVLPANGFVVFHRTA